MTASLVIGHGNVYAANRTPGAAVRVIRAAGADSFGINEGNRMIGRLRAIPGYRLTLAPVPGRARETPILTRDSLQSLGSMALRVSRAADPIKFAPDRWVTVSLFDHPLGRTAHLSCHLNANVTGVPTSTPRVREYAASTDAIGDLCAFLERDGYRVVLTGDVNMTEAGSRGVPWAAQTVLESLGLVTHPRGVELLAHSRSLRLVELTMIGKERTGSDHPFMVATLRDRR